MKWTQQTLIFLVLIIQIKQLNTIAPIKFSLTDVVQTLAIVIGSNVKLLKKAVVGWIGTTATVCA